MTAKILDKYFIRQSDRYYNKTKYFRLRLFNESSSQSCWVRTETDKLGLGRMDEHLLLELLTESKIVVLFCNFTLNSIVTNSS